MPDKPVIRWQEAGVECAALWRAESGTPPPRRVLVTDDRITADAAYRLACEGTALFWRGDFQNARQLLQALARRGEASKSRKGGQRSAVGATPIAPATAFHLHRQAQSQRARTLGMLLLPFDADHNIPLRRAPDVRQACIEAYGSVAASASAPMPPQPYVASLRELLGLIGAHEWRKKGVAVAALGASIHPHYGVFAPVRGEYVDLVAAAPLPAKTLAFDIGTGSGVLAAILVKRGMSRVVATDTDPRALACASANLLRLGYAAHVTIEAADLFPVGRAALVVCNPPWLPARPSSPIEYAIFDPDSRMLRGFLAGLGNHLEPGGEGWLILSDLAEHLGLRTRIELLAAIDAGGLKVIGRIDARPHHPKVSDPSDPLHAARAAEITSLWRLTHQTVTSVR